MSPASNTEPIAADGNMAAMFYGQLSGLLKAGMPLPQALKMLAAEAGSARFRGAVNRAAEAIENGAAPETAFNAESRNLGGILGQIAAASATSGRLAPLLAELSAWTLTQERIRAKIVDALAYPFVILFLAALINALYFPFLHFVGLDFQDVEKDMEEAFGSNAGSFYFDFAFWLSQSLFVALCGIALLPALPRFSSGARSAQERLRLWLPVARAVCRPLALTRFCGSVSILMKAGVPFHAAVATGGELSGYAPYAAAAADAGKALETGVSPSQVFTNTRLFPSSMRVILASAEQRGDMPEAFAELARIYEIEAEARGRIIAIVAPPACLIMVGAIISMFIYGMIRPLVEIISRMT